MIKYSNNWAENLKIINELWEKSDTRNIETYHDFSHRIRALQQIEIDKRDLELGV